MVGKLLLVDDAPIIRLKLKNILVKTGITIIGEANNGQEAVEKFKELKPDLMTMDIVMPIKDGITALEEILTFDKTAKVVMVTAIDQRDSLMKAIRLGAVDYIVKPFDDARVIEAIGKALGQTG
ncbi:MAG: response regulator [Candidatus Omnitrophica bacterium]|nr:response regulator [Candidatus Omnitrophota bacterium]